MSEPLPVVDQQLELKKRARRRLIGAVVFATIAAVILPMVMDNEPPAALPNIELRIPAQEKGFVAPTLKLPPPAPVVQPPAEPIPAPIALVPIPSAVESAVRDKAVVVLPKAATVKPETKPKVEAAPAKPSRAEIAGGSAVPATESKRAQAILEGRETRSAKDVPHIILIGAFADPANVENLRKKIGEMGIRVFTEPLESSQGKKIRVRAGPFSDREAAMRAAERIKTIGVRGVVAAKP